ncbi:MAG: 30S ribosomal protein S8 [bacterium]|nr:30S ribosomal protein S8 [bacterium]
MMTDPIADMLTRIRNAQSVGRPTVQLPASKVKRAIAELLAREGWLARVDVRTPSTGKRGEQSPHHELVLTLRYRRPGEPQIQSIRRISRPGHRVYVKHGAIPTVKRGAGMAILSTPQGIVTNREAKVAGIGGELICELY